MRHLQRSRRRRVIGGIATWLVLLACVAVAPATATPLVVRLGWITAPAEIMPMVYMHPTMLKHYGKSYTVELTRFRGSGPPVAALAAKEVDLAALSYASFANAILNAKLDLRVVADDLQLRKENFSGAFVVKPDSAITSVAQIRGKTVGVQSFGSGADLSLRMMMRRHGLEAFRDYNIIEVGIPNQLAYLQEGKLDVANLTQPFYSRALAQKKGRPLFFNADSLGNTQFVFYVARREFLDRHRAVLGDFFEDFLRGWRWVLAPANRDAVLDLAARVTKQPRAIYESWMLTKLDYFRDADALPDIAALNTSLAQLKEMGFTKESFDATPYLDLSFIKQAAERLR
ncbi:MAG: ABC transporter substrate-binding protein [Candidatus Tectomicrobia bacterium]|nr:ABC transporter substrate-binding protein [Candidatus Tectomicrobia bacterium]